MDLIGKGKIYYGMHFYPGVAEYQEPDKEPYRVFLNEDTIRSMDPSFAGRPIFVEHVNEVEDDVDELRSDADGWVIESFYNAADGKHWVKFIVVSEAGEKAIQNGMRLSNAYVPKSFGQGGLWNGVAYAKEITGGEYEHLAIVRNPRYEESVIMTPEQFKLHNENNLVELKRLSNSKENKGETKMAFKLFKRTKVENSIDIEGMLVVLPKSGKEISITKLVNEADEMEEAKKKNEVMADPEHKVKMHDGSMCNVGELLEKHKAMNDELEAMKAKHDDKDEGGEDHDAIDANPKNEDEEISEGEKDVGDRGGDKSLDNEEEDEKKLKEEKKKNSLSPAKKAEAKKKADALRNAGPRNEAEETTVIKFSGDQVALGKSRYGSN